MDEKMQAFFGRLKKWQGDTHVALQQQLDMNDQINNEYDMRMKGLSKQRGDANLRFESAIKQALVHQKELDGLQSELKRTNDQSAQVCQDLRRIKAYKAELQTHLEDLKQKQQELKQELIAQVQSHSALVTKFALFLGLEVIPTELVNLSDYPELSQNHDGNFDDDNQVYPGCILIRYTSLQPRLSFILNPSPISVSHVSLPLSNLPLLQQHLIESQNLHHFFVKLYFLHKETYPQQELVSI